MKLLAQLVIFSLLFSAIPVLSQTKGVGVKAIAKLPSKEKRWALIVGIDNFGLRGSVNDAKALREVLIKYGGFPTSQVILLTSDNTKNLPTRNNIINKLEEIVPQIPSDGLFLFSFSGHGKTDNDNAYLIPSDGAIDDNFTWQEKSINVNIFKNIFNKKSVQQVIMFIDSCRDRTAGRGKEAETLTPAITRGFSFDETNKNVEVFVTLFATKLGEKAFEYYHKETKQYRGFFSKAIEEALAGEAANDKGEITLDGLVKYVQEKVPERSSQIIGFKQTPFKTSTEALNESEFVLAVSNPKPTDISTETNVLFAKEKNEINIWKEIKASNDPKKYEEYLKRCEKKEFECNFQEPAEIYLKKSKEETKKWLENEKKPKIEFYETYLLSCKKTENLCLFKKEAEIKSVKSKNEFMDYESIKNSKDINILSAFVNKCEKGEFLGIYKETIVLRINKLKQTITSREYSEFEKTKTITDPLEKVNVLRKFKANYSNSEFQSQASELLSEAFAKLGDEKIKVNEIEEGIGYYKQAVKELPQPVSDEFFIKVIAQIPANLFYRGQQTAALEIAQSIELKIGGSAKQLLGLATFYIGIEDGKNAKNLDDKALALEPNSFNTYQTLGLANRLLFDLSEAENAYKKALEIEPTSIVTKRSLAEMKRAVGKPNEAETIYRELLATDENDSAAQAGLVLSLFDGGKQTEAEAELTKTLEKNPNNFFLNASIGYWYAAHNNNEKAVEFASRAISSEPRFVWGQIALARGLQKRPLDAERSLIFAQQEGNFPTLTYEIANARVQAGFYEEAASELNKVFTITPNGLITTQLGNRIPVQAKNFIELLSLERRVAILQPVAADSLENAERMRNLLNFSQKLNVANPNENEIKLAADEFMKGNDPAKTHRQLYVASRLLQRNIALPRVFELMQEAMAGVDAAAAMPNASTATLADELFDSRQTAFKRNSTITIPEIPKETLTNILRGRIEELTGSTLYLQQKYPEAIVRLKRAVGIFPDKSVWFRNSQWKLGMAYEVNGNTKEALDLYIKSYKTSEPSFEKYTIIELLYQKVNGNVEGLKDQIGDKPAIQIPEKPFFSPKVIVVGQKKPDEKPDNPRPKLIKGSCSLISSQDSVSILNNGGRLGILLTIEGDGNINKLTATSSSNNDIEVLEDSEMVKVSNRLFFIIKSISEKTGNYKVVFESPCGKKEIEVRVR